MKLKALCFVALVFATVLVSSAATETSKDEKKSEAVATDKNQDRARDGNFREGKCSCCGRHWCHCCRLDDKKEAKTVTEKNQAAEGATSEDVVRDEATGQHMPAGYGGGGWGGGGPGGGGGWGGGGGHGGGGHGGWGSGRRCPHCTAVEAHERARSGKS